MHTTVIVEPGACHDGLLTRMLQLVDAAADAKADAFKPQFWSDPDRLASRRRATDAYRDLYRRYGVPLSWLPPVVGRCRAHRLRFGLSIYLPEDVEMAVRLGVDFLKVASFEAEAADLTDRMAPYLQQSMPLYVSLGMGARRPAFTPRALRHVYWLHCVSAYPAPVEALGLRRLQRMREAYDGFSDHSDPMLTWTGALAVAAGASVVEAHLRLDGTSPENPDAPHAMTPQQFAEYVRHIRFAEACLGDVQHHDRMHPCEAEMAQFRVRGSREDD